MQPDKDAVRLRLFGFIRVRTIRSGNAAGAAGFCRPAGTWAPGDRVNPGLRPGLSSAAPPALDPGDSATRRRPSVTVFMRRPGT